MSLTPQPAPAAPVWKRVVASILDFFTAFAVGGPVIGKLTGSATDTGFSLHGLPALALFALVALYFFVGRKYAGGTVWDRIFGIRRPQPN